MYVKLDPQGNIVASGETIHFGIKNGDREDERETAAREIQLGYKIVMLPTHPLAWAAAEIVEHVMTVDGPRAGHGPDDWKQESLTEQFQRANAHIQNLFSAEVRSTAEVYEDIEHAICRLTIAKELIRGRPAQGHR